MTSFFSNQKKNQGSTIKKIAIFLVVFLVIFFISFNSIKPAFAFPTEETSSAPQTIKTVLEKTWDKLKTLLKKAGSIAFQKTVSSALNKIAYDAANYIGSGGEGQKPLFTKEYIGDYLTQIGDEAAGQFVETFANTWSSESAGVNQSVNKSADEKKCNDDYSSCSSKCTMGGAAGMNCTIDCTNRLKECLAAVDAKYQGSGPSNSTTTSTTGGKTGISASAGVNSSFNICQPASLESKVKITLGLVEQQRPQGPSCSFSEIVDNWEEAVNLSNEDFLTKFKDIFDPRGNELGAYWTARTDLGGEVKAQAEYKKSEYETGGGWLDVRDIAGKLKSPPGEAENAVADAKDTKKSNFGKVTGDILVDAANTFLNQLAISAFNNLMQSLGEKASSPSGSNTPNVLTYEGDPNVVFGEATIKEITRELLQPSFGERADYNILSSLAICPDPQNPGPANCALDSSLMQGITEKKTVAEAIKEGYLQSSWQFTQDNANSSYSLRNISILRKYRILPIGWEVAIQKAYNNPNNIKKVTLMDLVSCFDKNDSYNQFSSSFDVRDQAWCQGLVDPNWVLKAPLNYCKKEGASAQILSKLVTPGQKGSAGTPDLLSEVKIARAEDYCADEQTCIKEKKGGSCEAYGYCNEEKRIWNFNEDSCEPIYNTCQTFVNSANGQTASYLENTLNYGTCSAESAGCRQYSLFGNYATSTGTVSWDAAQSLYFNKNTENCSSKDEGCTELMRVKPSWGSNLVMDADFGNEQIGASSTSNYLNDWPIFATGISKKATIVNAAQEPGGSFGKALKLETNRSGGSGEVMVETFSNYGKSLLPANLQIIAGQAYTLSADIYLVAGDKVQLVIGAEGYEVYEETREKNKWQHITITRTPIQTFSEPSFIIAGYGLGNQITFYIKNVKFEMSNWDTGFSAYGSFKTYEKLIPAYLEKTCYIDATSASKNYRLSNNAPGVCYNYARKCNRDEVDCELYISSKDDFQVPAKVTNNDYCPKECAGYNVYIAKESYFNSPQAENLLPSQAQACGAEAAGCNEFTNLDELGQGGEGKEYYNYLKQCIKPDVTLCSSFYSWEGVESGYQLKAYSLKKDNLGGPAVTSNDSALCNATIYNLPLSDPDFDPDCREFYNAAGQIFYHLLSRTITCSENCHAYRLTDKNFDKRLTQAECTGTDKHWDSNNNLCYVCLNGGLWNTNHQACLYQAIPNEGKICGSNENGCREYNGNDGNNVRILSSYDYENGLDGWYSNCTNGIQLSTISNNRNGHSVLYNNNANQCSAVGAQGGAAISRKRIIEHLSAADNIAAQLKVSGVVTEGQAYNVKFLARASSDTTLQIYFLNKDTGEKAYFNPNKPIVVRGGNEWAIYQTNLESLDHEVGQNERLIITGSNNFYFDDFVLTEITDRYYLIKNSSLIPDICYYDIFDNYQGADYNLGCSQYFDRNNVSHYLRQFTKVCSMESVGCEQMIDTKNYAPYQSGIWKDDNNNGVCDQTETDCVTVTSDSALYAVYDANKQCNSVDLGCSLLGQAQGTNNSLVWSDVFKKNNPNNYQKILCGQNEVGCEEWRTNSGGLSYFKDPGMDVCSYRASQDPTIAGKAWYKIPVKRCDYNADGQINGTELNRAICSTEANCGDKPCIIDTNDYPCSVSYFKTIGFGGSGNQIATPDQQTGLCDNKNSGCTEYIDPVSKFSPNLIYNPYLSANRDGWIVTGGIAKQTVKSVEYNKLYIFRTDGTGNISLTFANNVKLLLMDNTLGTSTKTLTISNSTNQPIIFDSLSNSEVLVQASPTIDTVEIREAIVDYQLKDKIDKKSCNGLTKFDNGCVLFNERSINGGLGLVNLETGWDAYASQDGAAPTTCDSSKSGSCTANQLIKVRPDRVCAKWLDCVTYIEDPETKERVCYAVGECNRLNDKNECANFITSSNAVLQFDPLKTQNASGYALVNKYSLDNMSEVGLNSEAHYDFEDSVPTLTCERVNSAKECSFTKNIVKDSLVREPDGAPTDYPANDKTYLKISADYLISPQALNNPVTLIKNSTYYINYLINTKNSGLAAKLIIKKSASATSTAGATITSFIDSANNGWQRITHQFTVDASKPHITIQLGADDPTTKGYVYFDDINIEPVLKINENEYAARECRLYPDSESLTCFSGNENVVNNGLEGYCLEHDKNNPNVCLLWYPVDWISSTRGRVSDLGYKGKAPLNYCTELNGNFDLVEKRTQQYVGKMTGCQNDQATTCYYSYSTDELGWWYNDPANCFKSKNIHNVTAYCGGDRALGRYWLLELNNSGGIYYFCMPSNYNIPSPISQLILLVRESESKKISGRECSEEGGEISFGEWSGWFKYDGLDNNDNRTGPYAQVGFNEIKNADPPVRVYDYDRPAVIEENLKLISSSDPDEVFRLTCNRFTQVVGNNNENKAWTDRINFNSLYATQTPPFFVDNNNRFYGATTTYNLSRYGRNREDSPFGAAAWPDNFDLLSSEPIKFRDQYSKKNNEEVFAGRPYGCSVKGTIDPGCKSIGYCSLDPNVFCLIGNGTSTDYVSQRTCTDGGFGACVPIWSSTNPLLNTKYEDLLRSIFIKSYNAFRYNLDAQFYVSDTGFYKDYSYHDIGLPPAIPFKDPCPGGVRNTAENITSFCAVWPQIKNVKLKLGNQLVGGLNPYNINVKGIYRLEFNTIVDKEQQPLKEIRIDWGDGKRQVITGQDHRPSTSTPHVFYHYYQSTGQKTIGITIYDNWGKYDSCQSSAGGGVCFPPIE